MSGCGAVYVLTRPKLGVAFGETIDVVECDKQAGHLGDHHGRTHGGGTGVAWPSSAPAPDLCTECGEEFKTGNGSYPDFCADCGWIAYHEDRAEAARDDR